MTRGRKARVALVGLGLAALWSEPASAARVDLDAVASVSLPPLPSTRPAAIGETDRLEGLAWQLPQVWGDEDESGPSILAQTSACVLEGEPSSAGRDDEAAVKAISGQLRIHPVGPRVRGFVREELITADHGAKLVIDRGWYDRIGGGLRRIDTTTVALTVISQDPLVYAFRDDFRLHVILPNTWASPAIVRDDEGRLLSFNCSHAHGAVPLDSAGATTLFDIGVFGADSTRGGRHRPPLTQISVSISRTSRDAAPWASLVIAAPR